MRLKWEYKAVSLGDVGGANGASASLDDFMQHLNRLGDLGWELVGVNDRNGASGGPPGLVALLKRPRNVWECASAGRVLQDSQ